MARIFARGERQSSPHTLNEGELEIRGTRYKVDGYCHATKTVYEFHGSLWHGCKDCYLDNRQTTKTPRGNQSMDELYALMMIKKKIISDLRYKYVSIWEHEWHKLLTENKDVADFVSTLDIQERLCALTNARTCKHSDKDRALMSTWCSS